MVSLFGQLPLSRPAVALACALAVALGACAHQGELYDDKDWTKDDANQTGAWREVESLFSANESDVDRFKRMLRGVRHDLTMADEAQPDVRCACMDVVLGPPDASKLRWETDRPILGEDQVAVAVRTDGAVCTPGAPAQRRPSIQAVDYENGDVIVVIEELPFDRPQALGAIVDLPRRGGAIYLRPRLYKDRVLPYGRSILPHGMCRLMRRPIEVVGPRSGT